MSSAPAHSPPGHTLSAAPASRPPNGSSCSLDCNQSRTDKSPPNTPPDSSSHTRSATTPSSSRSDTPPSAAPATPGQSAPAPRRSYDKTHARQCFHRHTDQSPGSTNSPP